MGSPLAKCTRVSATSTEIFRTTGRNVPKRGELGARGTYQGDSHTTPVSPPLGKRLTTASRVASGPQTQQTLSPIPPQPVDPDWYRFLYDCHRLSRVDSWNAASRSSRLGSPSGPEFADMRIARAGGVEHATPRNPSRSSASFSCARDSGDRIAAAATAKSTSIRHRMTRGSTTVATTA
jgi:hypothetical protein